MNTLYYYCLNVKQLFSLTSIVLFLSINSQAQYFFEEYSSASAQGFCSENVKQTSSGYLLYGKKEGSSIPQFLTIETDLNGNQVSVQQINFSDPSAQYERLEDGNFIKETATADGITVEKIAPDESVIWSVDVNSNNNFAVEMASGIWENAQGDIFVGFFTHSTPVDIFVSKIDAGGSLLWTTTFDANQYNISNGGFINEMNITIALDDNGVAVDFFDSSGFWNFNRVVKLDAQGVYEFDNYSGGFSIPNDRIFESGINGNYFTIGNPSAQYGSSARSFSYTGNAIHSWNPNYNVLEYTSFSSGIQEGLSTAIEATADGGLLIGGFKTEKVFTDPVQEMYLVKVDELGEVVFVNVNFPFVGYIKNITELSNGDIMLSGLRDNRPWMLLVNSDGNPSAQSCPTDIAGYDFEGAFRGHHYFLSQNTSNYTDALAAASNNGGYLVTIEDQVENGKVFSFMAENTSTYIGLNDIQNEGSPEWANGENFDYDNTDQCVGCPANTNENDVTTYNFWSPNKWSWEQGGAYRPHLMEHSCEENNSGIVNDLPNDLGFQGCIANVASNILQKDRESSISSTATEEGLNSTNWWKGVDGDQSTFVESQSEQDPTWETTLFYDNWVDEIRIYPRQDGQFPLENIRIQISSSALSVLSLDTLLTGVQPGNPIIFPFGKTARLVRIIKEGVGVLSFSEIEIMGCTRDIFDPIRFECPKDMVVNAGPDGTYVVDYDDEQFNLDCLGSGNGGYQYRGPQEGDEILPGDYLFEIDSGNDVCGYQYCNIMLTVLPYDSGNGEITINCPSDITVIAPTNSSEAVVNWNLPEAGTSCTEIGDFTFDQQIGLPNGSIFQLGTYTIEYAISDACGNIKNCSFNVTVETNSNSTCPDSINGYILLGEFENHKYYVSQNVFEPWPNSQNNITTVKNWIESEALAEANGGYLASINSAEENEFIFDKIGNTSVFIGLSDLQGDGTYEWDSEEPITYTNYDGNFPTGVVYGTMNFWSGTWTFDQGLAIRPHILEVECGTSTGGNGITMSDCSSEIIVEGTHANNYNEVVTWNIPTATTDCPNGGLQITQIAGTPSGSSFNPVPSGHPVVYEITDACGNTETCLFFIYVNPEAPIYECPADITVTATSGTGAIVNYAAPTLTSFCSTGNYEVVTGLPSGNEFPIGTTTVQLRNILSGSAQYCGGYYEYCSFTVTVEDPNGGGCPGDITGFTSLGEFGDSKYFISDVPAQPIAAQMEAEANGGFLAVINDEAENDFIQQNITDMVYIGLYDATTEGTLAWINGEPLTYNNINPCSFCNENSDDLDYVIMAPWDGTWSFSSVWNSRKYIMEVPCDGNTGGGNEPDLTVSNLTNLASSGSVGEVVSFNFDLNNIGTITAIGSYNINTYISTDDSFSNDDVLVGEVPTGDTPVGTIAAVPAAITIPNLSDGNYFLIVVADALNQISESNENNNNISTSFEITSGGGGGCPSSLTDFTYLGAFNGSAYFLSDDVARPVDGQNIAAQNGGHLAVINSQAENDFLSPQISELVYIGINDFTTEGTLEWVNDDPVNYTNFDICNFCNENSEEMDFVVMHGWNGGWSWSNFFNQRKYIVEIPCGNIQTLSQNTYNTLDSYGGMEQKTEQLTVEKIHPNPANDFIFITLESSIEQDVNIQIFDAQGSLVRFEKLNLYEGKSTNEISISELPAGVYSIFIPQLKGANKMQRFVKLNKF